jgi:hypothetical protein
VHDNGEQSGHYEGSLGSGVAPDSEQLVDLELGIGNTYP